MAGMSSLILHLGPIDAALLKSGHQKCSIKKPVLKNFCNIHRKTIYYNTFLVIGKIVITL